MAGLALVVVGTKYEPAGTGWPARPGGNPVVAGGLPFGPGGVATGYVAGHGDAGQITGNGSFVSIPISSVSPWEPTYPTMRAGFGENSRPSRHDQGDRRGV